MKAIYVAIFSLFLLSFCTSIAFAVKVGEAFPFEELEKATGTKGSTFKGKVTIVNFWATWCKACGIELEEMATLFKKEDSPGLLNYVFISLDADKQLPVSWVKKHISDKDFILDRLLIDSQFVTAEALSLDSFPVTLIVDAEGKIAYVQNGFEEGKGLTERLLAEAKRRAASLAKQSGEKTGNDSH